VSLTEEDAIPDPVVFLVKDHAAALIWDGQGEDSRYHGYAHGQVTFRNLDKPAATGMLVTGRADPGLLTFAKDGRRGFQVSTTYRWDGQAYVPGKTEYSLNADYTLYRFISALHLHEYSVAYSLIDAKKFLQTDSPNLEVFRQFIKDSWPEFLGDQVFEAREAPPGAPDDYAFSLPEKDYVYHPTFSSEGKFLLTGLERREETRPAEPNGLVP
jgi:hypothetical protein